MTKPHISSRNILYLAGMLVLIVTLISFVQATPDSAYADTSCDGGTCQTHIYSYEKYWLSEGGTWEDINESFYDCSHNEQTLFCTRDYHFKARGDASGAVSVIVSGETYTLQLTNFLNRPLSFTPSIEGNVLSYNDVIPGVNLRYIYLPSKLKEEIVIPQPLAGIPEESFNLTFSRSGTAPLTVQQPYVCDANFTCTYLSYHVGQNEITVEFPGSFLTNPQTAYPVVIDPTLVLNDTYVRWWGHVSNITNASGTVYDRDDYVNVISLSNRVNNSYRADIDWNITSLSNFAEVRNVTMTLHVGSPVYPFTVMLNHMGWNNNSYNDSLLDCGGNCWFYTDMGNGTEYNESDFYTKSTNFDFPLGPEAAVNLQSKLLFNIFSVGLSTDFTGTISIATPDATNVSTRPVLTILYGANETDGDKAIETGINYSIANNPFQRQQQVYLVNEDDQHYLGTFDRTTSLINQTWAFNYVTNNESFINMPSLFRILNVWENTTLSTSEIITQVGAFINATKF